MARKVGQIIARGDQRWLIRVYLGRDRNPPILADVGEGASFTMLGTTMRLIARGASSGGRFTVGEHVTPVGWGPPRHIHSREDEIFYVLEGTYEMHVGDELSTLSLALV